MKQSENVVGIRATHPSPPDEFSPDDIRDVVFRTDAEGRWTNLNAAWTEVTGFARGESLGRLFLEYVHPDDRERNLQAFEPLIQRKKSHCFHEVRYLTKAGGFRWIEVHARLTLAADGSVTGTTGTLRDVTERREFQEKLVAAVRVGSVGSLAAGVAHEINNPLTWLQTNLGTLRDMADAQGGSPVMEAGRPHFRELVDELIQGTARIAGVVRAMRSLGQPRSREGTLVSVRAELMHALELVRNQLQERARLAIDLPEALASARAPSIELGRAFLNLLVNAVQAIPEGSTGAHSISVSGHQAGNEVVVEITDSGCGIPADHLERVFDPFFTTRPVGKGAGLGLTMARGIVEEAGGRIEVVSQPGRGSTFRVRLPLAPDLAPAPSPAPPPTARATARRRVLVVDDEPLIRRALQRHLGQVHDVTTLDCAAQALERLQAGETWDAILCDLMMPGLDGVAFYECLAASHPRFLPRIAFITGGAYGDRAVQFLAENSVPIVDKPMRMDQLLDVVERLAQPRA